MTVILVVDDHVEYGVGLIRLLAHLGYAAHFVESATEAMDWLGRNPLPSLVISDLMMPEMTGVDLLRRLRSDPRTAELPVIIFSAAADGPLHDKALEAGANAFWTKGRVDFASLRQLIDSHSRPVVALES